MECTLNKTNFCTLNEQEMSDVNGGIAIPVILGAAAAVWIVYEIGYAVGKVACHIVN